MPPTGPSRRALLGASGLLLAGAPALDLAGLDVAARAQGAPPGAAPGEKALRYGISMADIPQTTGQPDRGAGAYQFSGHTLYDPLVAWDMTVADRPGRLVPGLATAWEADPADRRRWTFRLREGVRFHDGSALDADAVVWNLEKVLNPQAPHFDQRQAAQVRPRLPSVASWRRAGPMTVEIVTKAVDSFFPYQMLWFLVSSPAQFEKVGRSWDRFAAEPSGTGPFRLARLVPRERAELVRNDDYWDRARVPKLDRLTLVCIPEALARTNALLTGQVDLIETPAPDLLPRLKAGGARIVENVTPHVWNYHLSLREGSPWRDLRLRQAANLALDRDAVVGLMNGLAKPAVGQLDPSSPWFGRPGFQVRHDPDRARALLREAGFSRERPVRAKFLIATGGSGQMLSLPINEYCQQAWREVGIEIEFQPVELEVLYTAWRQGAGHEALRGITANNVAYVTSDPLYALIRFYHSGQTSPVGVNWSHYADPETDALIDAAVASFDPAEQDRLLARVHERVVDQALQVWVVHDTNPHALGRRVGGYVQAQHWFQDLTTLS